MKEKVRTSHVIVVFLIKQDSTITEPEEQEENGHLDHQDGGEIPEIFLTEVNNVSSKM